MSKVRTIRRTHVFGESKREEELKALYEKRANRRKKSPCITEKKKEAIPFPIEIIPEHRFKEYGKGHNREKMLELMQKEPESIVLARCEKTIYLCVNNTKNCPNAMADILAKIERSLIELQCIKNIRIIEIQMAPKENKKILQIIPQENAVGVMEKIKETIGRVAKPSF